MLVSFEADINVFRAGETSCAFDDARLYVNTVRQTLLSPVLDKLIHLDRTRRFLQWFAVYKVKQSSVLLNVF